MTRTLIYKFSIITQVIIENPRGDCLEIYVINVNNHLQVIITVKTQKQDDGYLCKCYRGDLKSASLLLSFK